jgi:uncharacterized membrane protein YdbT with pleckstrin-like domain
MAEEGLKFRRSRWRYFLWYALAAILIVSSIYAFDSGYDFLSYVMGFMGVIMLILLEFQIRYHVLILNPHEIIMKRGLFSIKSKTIAYSAIVDVGVHQTFLQRLFRYGQLEIDTPGTSGIEIIMPAICRPWKIEKILRERARLVKSAQQGVPVQRPVQKQQVPRQQVPQKKQQVQRQNVQRPMDRMGQTPQRRTR